MKEKKELAILLALLIIAGSIWYWFFFRQKTLVPAGTVAVTQNYNRLLSVENPAPHTDRREAARRAVYKGSGRNPFSSIAPLASSRTPDHVVVKREPVGPQIVPPPPPPEIPANMHFYGYGTVPNGTSRRAFFTDGEDVFIVSEGEVFLNRFRILKINNASLDFEEVSSGRHGTKVLEEQPASPAV
jgi:hypothetical protein